ncbi:MAG: ABC transporter ATP-binding protein [Clostridia bacterium]|jgi:ABC-type bacteriocin/lantibiotic exporter with double-glycine peptidase domain|nr:ABC transporter ATP-binding protein [Clostridia bacterium]
MLIKSYIKQSKLQFISNNIISLIYFIASLIFYIVCAVFVVNKSINIAQYISIAAYYGLVSSDFQDILKDNMQFQSRKTSVERVFALLEEDYEDESGLDNIKITDGRTNINNLSFSYQKDIVVLNDISFSVSSGEKIGIVGESGVGKSTIAHLLIKYFTPENGDIVIDGQNIAKCTYSSIRNNIGIVSQEVIIFDTSIKENICFDKSVPDDLIWNLLDKQI